MSQSRTLSIGMDVYKDSIAAASVSQDHHAAVTSLGALGTRPCAIDQRLRTMPSKSQHRVFVSEAGPCGYWLSRSSTHKGHVCWVVAPALSSTKAGDWVTTHRRDAIPLAHLMRASALTPVSVSPGRGRRHPRPASCPGRGAARSQDSPASPHRLAPAPRSPLYGPGNLGLGPSPLAQ